MTIIFRMDLYSRSLLLLNKSFLQKSSTYSQRELSCNHGWNGFNQQTMLLTDPSSSLPSNIVVETSGVKEPARAPGVYLQ